jgi:hypothetical protein
MMNTWSDLIGVSFGRSAVGGECGVGRRAHNRGGPAGETGGQQNVEQKGAKVMKERWLAEGGCRGTGNRGQESGVRVGGQGGG